MGRTLDVLSKSMDVVIIDAPPVLMVAGTWGWDLPFMLSNFGWKAALAVVVNALGATLLFRKELRRLAPATGPLSNPVPLPLILAHIGFLLGVVVFAHHPAMFMGIFLLFLGIANAYERYQDRLILREGLLVAFFLAGLVTLGGMQSWWLQPLLSGMTADQVFLGATALTPVTDNAALTYLGSLVQGLSDEFKYMLVAGAVAGGAFAPLLGLHPAQGAAVGFVAVVASASNTPVAAVIMGVELFGAGATLHVAGACAAAYLMIGHRSVYPAQEMIDAKSAWLVATPNLPVGQEKLQLSYGLLRWWGRRLRRRRSGR